MAYYLDASQEEKLKKKKIMNEVHAETYGAHKTITKLQMQLKRMVNY